MSTSDYLFPGTPISQEESCGWMERQDALHQVPGKPMPPPWHWEIHDHSMATLCGGGEDAIVGHIMSIGPCRSCAKRATPEEWQWGRCCTPSQANATLIAAAPELLAALNGLIANAGYHQMTDNELREEQRLGNGFAPFLLAARAAVIKATGAA